MSFIDDRLPLDRLPAHGTEVLRAVLAEADRHPGGDASAQLAHDLVRRAQLDLDGFDIATFRLDATGVLFPEAVVLETAREDSNQHHLDAYERSQQQPRPEARRIPGVVRFLHVNARPAIVLGVDVHLELTAQQVPVEWIEYEDGGAALIAPEPERAVPGDLWVSTQLQPLVEAFIRTWQSLPEVEDIGLQVQDARAHVRALSPRTVQIDVDATVKKGILRASAQVAATATVDDALRLHLSDVRVSSRNVVIGAALALLRGRITAATAEPIDLASDLPPGLRVRDLHIQTEPDLSLRVIFG